LFSLSAKASGWPLVCDLGCLGPGCLGPVSRTSAPKLALSKQQSTYGSRNGPQQPVQMLAMSSRASFSTSFSHFA
jgi:hypothetical protein